MELRHNVRRATPRPIVWFAAILIAVALGLAGWYALPKGGFTRPTAVQGQPANAAPLLDRAAERQPQGPTAAPLLDREAERQP